MKQAFPAPLLQRPFLKWPGGKFRLVKTLKKHLPEADCLVEPFVGAGALFLNTTYSQIILNDINEDLITLYRQLQANNQKFILDAKKMFVSKNNHAKAYYRWREIFNTSCDPWERSVLFLYLNRHGYNGLCRYNAKGGFNVPFGDYSRPYFPAKELGAFTQQAQNATFHCKDYATLLSDFLKSPTLNHMVFYCDPPYAPLTSTANFTGYAKQRFTLEDQKKLAKIAKALAKKGATILISNHDTPFTREIYRQATLQQIEVSRTISCQGKTRGKVAELIACY